MTTQDAEQFKNSFNDQNIYAKVTQKILADLENGHLTWRKPWNSTTPLYQIIRPLRSNGVPYSGINKLLLWIGAAEKGFQSPYWMTQRQANDMSSNIKAEEKSTTAVFADKVVIEATNEEGEKQKRESTSLKGYSVFNAEQIEGLPEFYYRKPEIPNKKNRVKGLENFFAQTKAEIYTGTKAAYIEASDKIEMPPFESFINAGSYYATLSHQMTHWTKNESRLNRDFSKSRLTDGSIAKEELIAELGACFLAAELGFQPMPEESHSAFFKSWINILKHDSKFFFMAASQAQKAVEYMMNLQSAQQPKPGNIAAEPKSGAM